MWQDSLDGDQSTAEKLLEYRIVGTPAPHMATPYFQANAGTLGSTLSSATTTSVRVLSNFYPFIQRYRPQVWYLL
jgi:hypothetical protein